MSACRSCGASVIWGLTPAGKRIPLDVGFSEAGNLTPVGKLADGTIRVRPQQPGDGPARYVSPLCNVPGGRILEATGVTPDRVAEAPTSVVQFRSASSPRLGVVRAESAFVLLRRVARGPGTADTLKEDEDNWRFAEEVHALWAVRVGAAL